MYGRPRLAQLRVCRWESIFIPVPVAGGENLNPSAPPPPADLSPRGWNVRIVLSTFITPRGPISLCGAILKQLSVNSFTTSRRPNARKQITKTSGFKITYRNSLRRDRQDSSIALACFTTRLKWVTINRRPCQWANSKKRISRPRICMY